MRSENVTRIIRKVYGKRYGLRDHEPVPHDAGYPANAVPAFMVRFYPFLLALRSRWLLLTIAGSVLLMGGGSLYYYNLLVTTSQDVLAARGKVGALMQRRNDISINLSKAVLDYSRHERGVLTAVVAMRSLLSENTGNLPSGGIVEGAASSESGSGDRGSSPVAAAAPIGGAAGVKALQVEAMGGSGELSKMMAAPDPPTLTVGDSLGVLSRLMAVAEQYPDLKLSATFQSLMAALIEVEKDLAAERIGYNDRVNVYTTNLMMFPVNICAYLFGFEKEPYFEADERARSLVPIAY